MSILSAGKDTFRLLQKLKAEMQDVSTVGRKVTVLPDDVWLVSYPKSGNTWTRFLLANLVQENTQVGFDNIELLVPDIYQHSDYYLQQIQNQRYLKSHEYFDPRYKRVIFIARDPRDVAISYYHHMIKVNAWNEEQGIDDFLELFLNGDLDGFGTWGENVGSWLGARPEDTNMLILRYEDMLQDTQDAIGSIAEFLGFKVDAKRAERIVENCSLEKMKKLEKDQAKYWKPLKGSRQDKSFIRQGKSGSWKEELEVEQAERIYKHWQWQMEILGYGKS